MLRQEDGVFWPDVQVKEGCELSKDIPKHQAFPKVQGSLEDVKSDNEGHTAAVPALVEKR